MLSLKHLKRLLKSDNSKLPSINVSLLGDTATQFLATAIKGMGVERGFNIELFEAEYNQVERQLMDPTSEYHRFESKYTVIFQSTHKLLETYSITPPIISLKISKIQPTTDYCLSAPYVRALRAR